jgi:hypothetical protein
VRQRVADDGATDRAAGGLTSTPTELVSGVGAGAGADRFSASAQAERRQHDEGEECPLEQGAKGQVSIRHDIIRHDIHLQKFASVGSTIQDAF